MLLDWLSREGGVVLSWWLLVTLAGLAVFPLCARLLSGLPDRGYTLARAAGLLVVGFVFWLLASLGFIQNSPGNIVLAWVIVLLISVVIHFRATPIVSINWREWWQHNRFAIIAAEALFIVLLLSWAYIRAHNPDLSSTEKPMEMMFLSSVMRSETFPPYDAWMSGYSISYYYFGYVLAAMLTTMSNVSSAVGFSMTNALLFALTALTAYGVTYNLVRSRGRRVDRDNGTKPSSQFPAILTGLLGMFLVVWMGNFHTALIEIPYQTRGGIDAYLQFFDTQGRGSARLNDAPLNSIDWFRASRVLLDRNLQGQVVGADPIDEFPQFSFLLADNHPHVLALPFAVLALGLALNVVLTGREPTRYEFVFYGLCLGGLVFLNTWDGPIYMVVLIGAEVLRRQMRNGRLSFTDWVEAALLGFALVGLTLVFYLPFFIGFRSQASGILPNVIYPTPFQQYFVMFGPFILLIAPFLMVEVARARRNFNWVLGINVALVIFLSLCILIALLLLIGWFIGFQGVMQQFIDENGGFGSALIAILSRRGAYIITSVILLVGIALIVGRLFPRTNVTSDTALEFDGQKLRTGFPTYPAGTAFALLLVGVGLVLTLLPEYVYLRDFFSVRINTIFKFYYQAWVVLSIAGAYAVYTILDDIEFELPALPLRFVYGALMLFTLVMGALYPILGIHTRMGLYGPQIITLDGGPTMLSNYDDYQAIMCLSQSYYQQGEIVVEAVIGSYWASEEPDSGRVGALTGITTLLGWENHESQWRGATYGTVAGTRPFDIDTLYNQSRWDIVEPIIESHGIDYIFYGSSERAEYTPSGEIKFLENLEPICQFGNSLFYRVRAQDVMSG